MDTRVIQVMDPEKQRDAVWHAAQYIRQGQVVAFPTETVYGLGANALDAAAVTNIFQAKGRPGDNPLIIHINSILDIGPLIRELPEAASKLAQAFWPGPLTIIFYKSALVPLEVTAGLDTVAIRVPSHPVARALIRESGVPIAAPSANRSGKPSPTTAQHVIEDLSGRIPLILDGGSASVGLESTVLDLTGSTPTILRPGSITLEMLQKVIGSVLLDPSILHPLEKGQLVRSPGMKYVHYAPEAPVVIVRGSLDKLKHHVMVQTAALEAQGKRVGILATDETKDSYTRGWVLTMGSRAHPAVLAANLFAQLRAFDTHGVDIIIAEGVDDKEEGLAVMNRMARAAGFQFVDL